jgi:UDP-GlcNAc:undecaprenyl-phosphate GlcNAc-1-phosphate transferase
MIIAFAAAAVVAAAVVPLTIALARRTGFTDRPVAWKTHARATPCLGGLAILLAVVAGLAAAGVLPDVLSLVIGGVALFAVGLVDDRVRLRAEPRVVVEAAVGVVFWYGGWGWHGLGSGVLEAVLSALWVVGVINAVNLLDLMDGVCTATVAASAISVAVLGIVGDGLIDGVVPLALAGACVGFLPYNLARPSRSFLGDSGTMLMGALLAASVMRAAGGHGSGVGSLVAAVLLVGLPLLDMMLRAGLRLRAGIPLMTGGHDSLADGLLERVGSVRAVSLLAAVAQLAVGLAAVLALEAGGAAVALAGITAAGMGAALAWALRTRTGATG